VVPTPNWLKVTTMEAGNLPGDGQAKSNAGETPRHAFFGLHEGFKNAAHIFGLYANAAIADNDGKPVIAHAHQFNVHDTAGQ
jgi:hypothetical protein